MKNSNLQMKIIKEGVKEIKHTNAIKEKRSKLFKRTLTKRKHKRNSRLKGTELTPKNK